jgi:hypothetical protein
MRGQGWIWSGWRGGEEVECNTLGVRFTFVLAYHKHNHKHEHMHLISHVAFLMFHLLHPNVSFCNICCLVAMCMCQLYVTLLCCT